MKPVALRFGADHPAFPGHFPGQPLVPGVLLLAAVLEAALAEPALAAAIGAAPRLAVAKFLAPVRPETVLELQFELTATALRFELRAVDRAVAGGHFERATDARV